MKNLKMKFLSIVGLVGASITTAHAAVFDVATVAAERAEFATNVSTGTALAVGILFLVVSGLIILKFVSRGSR